MIDNIIKEKLHNNIQGRAIRNIMLAIICAAIIVCLPVGGRAIYVNATSYVPDSANGVSSNTTTEQNDTRETVPGNESSDNDSSLQDMKREYEQVKKEADANSGTAKKFANEIREMNLRLADEAKLIESAHNELADIDMKIEQTERSLIEYEENLAVEKDHLYNSIRMEYEDGSRSLLSILTNTNRFSDIAERLEYSNRISNYLNDRITAYQFMQDMVTKSRDSLNELKKQREEELVKYDKKKAGFKQAIDEMTVLMKEAKENADNAYSFATELETEIARMEAEERLILAKNGYNQTDTLDSTKYTGDGTTYYYKTPYAYNEEELLLFAGIIEAEAGSDHYPGMMAVASVVMNRVESPRFDNTLEGVIYADGQFEPVRTGRLAVILARGPAVSCIGVAKEALDGKRNVPNYYFKAAWYAAEHGIEGVNIGGNVFH